MFHKILEFARRIMRSIKLMPMYVTEDLPVLSLAAEHDEERTNVISECRRAGYTPIARVVQTPTSHFTNSRMR